MGKYFTRFFYAAFLIVFIFSFVPFQSAQAAPILTITPLTWNVIGLDSNNVNVGPNNFPVGARVCNTGTVATNLVATFVWDTSNAYIDLRSGSLSSISLASLAAGTPSSPSCYDFYFEVSIVRNAAAYNTTRSYHINVTETSSGTISTPTPREIFVEHLISQNRNSTDTVKLNGTPIAAGGTMSLLVGNTYTIELDGSTATQGYNQLEDFINFPNTIFQILGVQSTYSANSSGYIANSSDKLYADACLWDNNPASVTYRSCIGSDGKTGGTITTTYTVKIIGGAGTTQTLNTLIYDFSGSSYHYNSDFSSEVRYASISTPLTMTKSFSPVSIAGGGTSTLSIAITNSSSSAITGVSVTDTLPTSPAQMSVASTPAASTSAGCVSPSFSPSGGATSITYTGGVAASSTCTISVNVTAPTNGTYINTTGPLLINGSNTGITATANLTVASQSTGGGFCPSNVTMANWTVPSGATNPPDLAGGLPTTKSASVATAALIASVPASTAISGTGHGDTASWSTYGYNSAGQYIEFTINTSNFSNVSMSFWVSNPGAGNGPSSIVLSYDKGSGFTNILTISSPATGFNQYTQSFTSAQTNTAGTTKFRLTATGANNNNATANLLYDDMIFTGNQTGNCPAVSSLPTLTKSFLTPTIGINSTSVLRFTLTNANTTQLTGVSFSDTLPSGTTVSASSSTVCSGTLTTTAPRTIAFSGGVIPASGSCTVDVTVTGVTAGTHTNTSGFISSTESGTNSTSSGFGTANLTVLAPPVISKSFSPNPIYSGDTSTLTFTITNPNTSTALSGIAFTDNFPANLVRSAVPASPQCGGGTVSSTATSITLSGGSLAAGGSCTVTVVTTSSLTGSYANTSGAVSATTAGTGNTASDTLGVQAVHPGISILKQVSSSTSGPWSSTMNVATGGNVYYRLIIENIGDVALSPVSVSDPTLNISSCIWPSTLPVGTSSVDPTATCIIGPVTAVSGTHANTATAHGTYSATVYDSTPSTATYSTTALTLVKSVAQGSFSSAGDVLNYSYTITNTGAVSLAGPVTVSDSNSTVTCPNVNTIGNLDANLDQSEIIVCTATYTVTAFDVSVGSITNTARATVNSVTSNIDQETIYRNSPDLVISKTNNTGGYATNGVVFNWTLTVADNGPQAASFTSGQTIVSDQLPSGPTYGSPITGSFTSITNSANISCSINGSNLLTCTASGATVTIGGTNGSFAVTIPVTPASVGSLVNSSAIVDPNSNVSESNEGNNTGSDAVTVNAVIAPTVTKAFAVSNLLSGGNTNLTVTIGNTNTSPITLTSLLTDTFPAGMTINTAGNTGTCSGVTATSGADNFTIANGTSIPAGGCTVIVNITSSTTGAAVNTIAAGALQTSAGNNASAATDTLNVYIPPTVTKAFGAASISSGDSTTLTLTLANPGANPGSLTTVQVDDTFPGGLTLLDATFIFTPAACGTVTTSAGAPSSAGDNNVRLTAASLVAGASCEVVMNVTSSTAGAVTNTTNAPSASGPVALTGVIASADLTVSTPTPTYTSTPTQTPTSTPTSTPTDSPTPTSTPTNTATATDSPTPTSTPTHTATATDSPTPTNTPTYTVTNSPTPTGTPTHTATATDSPTPTSTPTHTATATDSLTPSSTPTHTATATDSPTPTSTPTHTATSTDSPTPTSTPTHTATATGTSTPTSTPTHTPTSIPQTDLALTKSVNNSAPKVGDNVIFTINIINQSSISATNITVADVLPAGFTLVSSNPPSGTSFSAPNWTIPSLAANSSLTLQLTVTVTQVGIVTNFVQITTVDQSDPDSNPNNNAGTVPVEDDEASVSIGAIFDPPSGTKTFNDAGLPELEFRMVWINSGNTFAIDTQVLDSIPAGTTYVAGSILCTPQGSSTNAGAASSPLSNTAVPNSFCGFDTINNRVQWQGNIGPDDANLTEATAANEVVITFRVTVNGGVNQVFNQGLSRTDVNNNANFAEETVVGTSLINSNQVVWNRSSSGGNGDPATSSSLPRTGYAPGVKTILPEQPAQKIYSSTDLWLEIPSLKVKMPIVGVPFVDGKWDVTWLDKNAGWLNGTAYPSWDGNSVLTGHVVLASGKPGPFANLGSLAYGDQVIIHVGGQKYIYEIRTNKLVNPSSVSSVIKHEELPWITLITCKSYNEKTGEYTYRTVVRAVLVKVVDE